jgi:MFS family permease
MFTMLGLSWALLPVLGAIGLSETRPQQQTRVILAAQPPRLGPTFGLLLAAALLSSAALNLSRLSTSLVMQALEFVPGAISSTGVVAGLATIPVLLVLGRFADQLGHRRVVALSYGLTLVGALVLSVASQLWHFQLAATLLFVAWCTRGSATAALTTALVPQSALGVALPQINAMENLAGIVGFASAGWLLDAAGERGLFVIAAGLLVGAIQLMGLLSHRMRVAASAAAVPAVRGAGGARAQVEAAQP